MTIANSGIQSLAQIEAQEAERTTRMLPFIDDKGKAVELIGDCTVEVKNITADSLTIELSPTKPPSDITVEVPDPKEEEVTIHHGGGSTMFSDGFTPKKMIAGGIGSTILGGSMIGGGYAMNAIARVSNTNSTVGQDNGTDTASISGALFLGGVGLVSGGLYNVFRGGYRWITGSAMTADVSEAVGGIKDAATSHMTAKFTKRV